MSGGCADENIKLTQFSHGAGCGCKIAPAVLDKILKSDLKLFTSPQLLVGNDTKDDAAVFDVGNGVGIVSTTDFFMPIVDDPHDFGRVAATNAISDIYAMGGKPIMAIAILGWPLSKLSPEIARRVVEGGRVACGNAGISLCGGHSIDAPEPIFGLAVTGTVQTDQIKRNSTATVGCKLYLTKPLGIGILTTAEKKKKLKSEHVGVATEIMCQLNKVGMRLSSVSAVKAMTDVTGFGLLGHLLEMCEGSNVMARVEFDKIPKIPGVMQYVELDCCPGGTERNFDSYGIKAIHTSSSGEMGGSQTVNMKVLEGVHRAIMCDPQTSGGLLVAVESGEGEEIVKKIFKEEGIDICMSIGEIQDAKESPKEGVYVVVV